MDQSVGGMNELATFTHDLAVDTKRQVAAAIAVAVAPLQAEIATLRAALAAVPRGPDAETLIKMVTSEVGRLPVPRDGKDADLTVVQAFIDAAVTKAVAALPVPKDGRDGKDVDPAVVDVMVAAQVERAVKAIPRPKDGENGAPGQPGEPGARGADGKDGARGADGKDGTSVTLADVEPVITVALQKAVSALPAPEKGRDGERGADGVGLADFIIDRSGHLIATLTDGRTKDLGPIHGKDVNPEDVERSIADLVTKTLETWERPKDGINGKDGLGFDDLDFEHDERGRLYLKFVKGDTVKRVRVPGLVDNGVWRAGTMYLKGDCVTFQRSLFICQKDHPSGKPEDSSGSWRLSVMRGRDAEPLKPQGDE